jgi:hypothetical protein
VNHVRLLVPGMFSRSRRFWSVLVVAVECVIAASSGAHRNRDVVVTIIELPDRGSNSNYWDLKPWHFIRFREVQNWYEQFAIEHNEYAQAQATVQENFRKIHPPPIPENAIGQVPNFRLFAWFNIANAYSEESFTKSYFYLLFRHYSDSKARFPQPILAVDGDEPYRETHIRVLERVISYLQNSFYLNIYFVPKITANNKSEQIGQIYPRDPQKIRLDWKIMITFFIEYCRQLETVTIHEAFSRLLDALDEISNTRVPSPIIDADYIKPIFQGFRLGYERDKDEDLVATIIEDFTKPVYVYRFQRKSADDKFLILMSYFEMIEGMCTLSSTPGLDKLADEFNRVAMRVMTEDEVIDVVIKKYKRAAHCPGMIKQASSTVKALDQDAKDILSDDEIMSFQQRYERLVPDCQHYIRQLLPIQWQECQIPNVILSGMPVKPLPKIAVTSKKVDSKEMVTNQLTKIMELDEFNYETWMTLFVMNQWTRDIDPKNHTDVGTRVRRYIKRYTEYWQKKRSLDLKKSNPKINESMDNSQPMLADTTRPEKAKPSKKKRYKLKQKIGGQDESPDVTYDGESAEASLGPGRGETLDGEHHYSLDDMGRNNTDIMQINSQYDTDDQKSTETSDHSREPGESSNQSAGIPSSDNEEATVGQYYVQRPMPTQTIKPEDRKLPKQLRKMKFRKGSVSRSAKQPRAAHKASSGIHIEGIHSDWDEGDDVGLNMSYTADQPSADTGANLEGTVGGTLLSEFVEGKPLNEWSPDAITSVDTRAVEFGGQPLRDLPVQRNAHVQASNQSSKITGDIRSSYF